MSKLTEEFNRFDELVKDRNNNETAIKLFEEEHANDEVLKAYKQLLQERDRLAEDASAYKDELYNLMLVEEIDMLDGKSCGISLKKPYVKTVFNTKQFLKDYTPDNKLYKRYVSQQVIKGNVIVKSL